MERESFVFYRSFYEALRGLPNDIKLESLVAVIEYALDGSEPQGLKPFTKTIFTLVKPSIDANTTRYENAKKGGRKSKPKAAPDPTYSLTYEEEIARLRADEQWKTAICEEHLISSSQCDTALTRFLAQCKKDEKKKGRTGHESDADLRDHFSSWFAKSSAARNAKTPTRESSSEADRERERRERNEKWERDRANATTPEKIIRDKGYDPAKVTFAQVCDPKWLEKNPPTLKPKDK